MDTIHLLLSVIAMAAVACGIGERCLKARRRASKPMRLPQMPVHPVMIERQRRREAADLAAGIPSDQGLAEFEARIERMRQK